MFNATEGKTMGQRQNQEWAEIIDLAKHNASLARWLEARDEAHRQGDNTAGYTRAIRREYRLIMKGEYT